LARLTLTAYATGLLALVRRYLVARRSILNHSDVVSDERRVVVVTGAGGSGCGRAIAARLPALAPWSSFRTSTRLVVTILSG
jgi:D-arabinose 5-phosphate isomerase GutQ